MIIIGLRAHPISTTFNHRRNDIIAPRKKQVPRKLILWVFDNPAHSRFDLVTRFRRVYFDSISIRYVILGVVHAITGEQDIHCRFNVLPFSLVAT